MGDLIYLQREAFEFSLEINPHAGVHERVEQFFNEDDADGWISPEQKAGAIESQKVIRGIVYPNGSVTFFYVIGTDVAAIIAECAKICRTERARYLAAK